jgi:hypothetical protein
LLSLSKAWNEPIPFPLDYYLHNSFIIIPSRERDKIEKESFPIHRKPSFSRRENSSGTA